MSDIPFSSGNGDDGDYHISPIARIYTMGCGVMSPDIPSGTIYHDAESSDISGDSPTKSSDSFSSFESPVTVFSVGHKEDKHGNYHQTRQQLNPPSIPLPPRPPSPPSPPLTLLSPLPPSLSSLPLSQLLPFHPSSPQVWLTIQNYSIFLNTMPPQSYENDSDDGFDDDIRHDENDNESSVSALDVKQGCVAHSFAAIVANALANTPDPHTSQRCTRKYFTLCSLDKYISQFSLTDSHINRDRKTDEYQKYQDLHSYFPSAIHTVTMTLYLLLQAPHIYLPLAPFRNAIYSAVELINTFLWGRSRALNSFDTICSILTGMLIRRMWHAVDRLYPDLKVGWGDSAPELEHERPPILEWLVRDALAAFNPIEIMLMFYRPIMAEYQQIINPTEKDNLLYFQRARSIGGWLHDMRSICVTYGLHIHDSQWVSMDEWKELAGYMHIIVTKMAPDFFDVVEGKHPEPTTDDDHDEISWTKRFYQSFLCCLAQCFTHHYRPMGEPDCYLVPFGSCPSSASVFCSFPSTTYSDIMTNLLPALEQYATMYVEDPQQFECEGSQAVLRRPPSTQHHDTKSDNNLLRVTPSSIRPAFDKMMKIFECDLKDDGLGNKEFRLNIPTYDDNIRYPLKFLLHAIVECPPVHDPVYKLFIPWFMHITDHMYIMEPDPDYWMGWDPQFTYNPSSSSSSSSRSSSSSSSSPSSSSPSASSDKSQ